MAASEEELLGVSCPGLLLEAAGVVTVHGAGTELEYGWRGVMGLFPGGVEDRKYFNHILKSLTFHPGTEIPGSVNVSLRPL